MKQYIVTGTSPITEADSPEEAIERAEQSSGWHWEAVEAIGPWPTTDVEHRLYHDWVEDVRNGDTILGFRDHVANRVDR